MMILSFFKRMIKRVFKYIKMILEGTTGLRRDWPEKKRIQYAMDLYERTQGYRFDINNPKLFTEKIVWYKLFYKRNDFDRIVDKCLFKDYIREKLGEGKTIPLIGVWDNVDALEKDWDKLPEEFYLKGTLQSDGKSMMHIKNRSELSFQTIRNMVASWLDPRNTLINSFCRAYYDAVPRVIAEEYKAEVDGQLYDYKVFCFDGKPECFYVAVDHFPGQLSHISFYDLDWNRLDVQYGKHPNCDVAKPREFDEMLRIAAKLSKGFPFLRVDFFETSDSLYVAELTLYPGGGQTPYHPESFNLLLGNKFNLPIEASKEK